MFSYLFSIFGLFTLLLGALTFLLLPIIPKATGRAKVLPIILPVVRFSALGAIH